MKGSGPLVATVLAASTVALTSSSSTGVQHVTSSPISSNQVMSAKPLLKEALQAEIGLPCDRDVPVIGFITRLEQQKGSDILAVAIPKFIGKNCQIVIPVSVKS